MKKLLCTLLALLLVLALCACNGIDNGETSEESTAVTTERGDRNHDEDEEGLDDDEDENVDEDSNSSETEEASSPSMGYPTGTEEGEATTPNEQETVNLDDDFVYVGLQANVRKEASPTSEKLGVANQGDVYPLIDERDGWYEILFDDMVGFVTKSAAVKKSVMDSFVEINDTVVITAEVSLNLRVLPSANSQLITSVPNGTVLYRTAVGDGWSRVIYTDHGVNVECYAPNRYIESLDDPAETTVSPILDEIASEINSEKVSNFSETKTETNYVKISFKNYGDVVIRLRPDIAPITVANFQYLVADGFYDGLTMHRIIKDFVIQGGDGEPAGRDADTVKGEFAANGVSNPISHVPGVISMARAIEYDSASSQFFIVSGPDALHLDGQYAGFGYVVAGLDIIDQIQRVETDGYDAPVTDVIIEKICFVTK